MIKGASSVTFYKETKEKENNAPLKRPFFWTGHNVWINMDLKSWPI